MRIARYTRDSGNGPEVGFGLIQGPDGGDPDGVDDADLIVAAAQGHPFAPLTLTGQRWPLPSVRLLAPVLPSKVLGIGKNYAAHAREMAGLTGDGNAPEQPLVFLKPSTSVIGPGDPVPLPAEAGRIDFEGELAVVIGRLSRDVPAARALEVVLGYTCANDVTARDWQTADGQWARAKGHDGFCPLGPWIETELDPADVGVMTRLDGELRQDGRTRDLIHDVPSLIAYVSSWTTLIPGDVILTGTPAGVGPLAPGQSVDIEVEGIGTLTNPVVAR